MLTGTLAGNFVAPLTFRSEDAPVYAPGLAGVVGTSIAVVALSMLYRFLCIRDNRKRDETGTLEAFDHAYEDDLTDKTVSILLRARRSCSNSRARRSLNDLTILAHRTRSFGMFCRYRDEI